MFLLGLFKIRKNIEGYGLLITTYLIKYLKTVKLNENSLVFQKIQILVCRLSIKTLTERTSLF